MAEVIRMPLMSDTMTEGVVADWLKKKGDYVEAGDILAEVETDKATMELESYQEGTLLYRGAEKGEAVPVNDIIAILGEEGEDVESILAEEKEKKKKEDSGEDQQEEKSEPEEKKQDTSEAKKEPVEKPAPKAEAQTSKKSDDDRLKVSPLARKMAEEKGIDLNDVDGSGDNGRIVKRDIENYTPSKKDEGQQVIQLPEIVGEEQYEEENVSQMRKTIARRLAESKFSAPHFYLTMTINMDKAVEARKSMNEVSPVKLSFNDLVIKAAAIALRQHPGVNASWREDKIRYNKHIHIGMAVAVDEGLLVPVIRFADNKPLSHISTEAKEFGQKAKDKKLQPADWEGNTFTVSNLGMFDIDEFTAIINPPDACILAVGSIKQVPAVIDGEIKPANEMKVTLSCDHRVVDGVTGAKFLQTFKGLLEDPVRLLI